MKKRREIIVWALVFLALAGIILLVFPYQKQISYRGTDYAYSPDDPSVAIAHEVVIEGTYIRYLLFEDVFQGTFYISDASIVNMGKTVHFKFARRQCAFPTPMDAYGQPISCDIASIFAEPNFTQLAVQFFERVEQNADGTRTASVSIPGSTFLVPGAKDRDAALETYMALLRESGTIE